MLTAAVKIKLHEPPSINNRWVKYKPYIFTITQAVYCDKPAICLDSLLYTKHYEADYKNLDIDWKIFLCEQ